MRWKAYLAPVLAALFIAVAVPAQSQVSPAATRGSAALSVGGGVSYFLLDYGFSRKMVGIDSWVDYRLPDMPPLLDGLGIEAEGRDINYDRPATLYRMRQDTYLGGPIYTWSHYRHIKPYGKYLVGIGSIDFPALGTYDHDTRVVFAPGIGVDYIINRHLKARADYEYQFWHAIFGSHDLNPNGVTLGVLYTFGRSR